jgi:hypothetical protein
MEMPYPQRQSQHVPMVEPEPYVLHIPTERAIDQLKLIYAPVGAHTRLGDNTCPHCGSSVRAYWNFFTLKTTYLYCSDDGCGWSAEVAMA